MSNILEELSKKKEAPQDVDSAKRIPSFNRQGRPPRAGPGIGRDSMAGRARPTNGPPPRGPLPRGGPPPRAPPASSPTPPQALAQAAPASNVPPRPPRGAPAPDPATHHPKKAAPPAGAPAPPRPPTGTIESTASEPPPPGSSIPPRPPRTPPTKTTRQWYWSWRWCSSRRGTTA